MRRSFLLLLPRTATAKDVALYHLHIQRPVVAQGLNTLLPLLQLLELVDGGEIRRSTADHYSYLGYTLKPQALLEESTPAMILHMKPDGLNIVVLVPGCPICCWSVGLVQRKIEAAGMSTITLSSIPDLTAAVGVPRLAAIEYPLGDLLGQPGDQEGQTAVLRATLQALVEMTRPGSVAHLTFEWPALAQRLSARPPKTPPISEYLLRHPWHIPDLFSRDVPAPQQVEQVLRPREAA
jgi:D-proline reductase (dithiol) PrdB